MDPAQFQIPSASAVDQVIQMAESEYIGTIQIEEALHSPILWTGLEHWELWWLLSLAEHTKRQKWVHGVVTQRLKADPMKIGRFGYSGAPKELNGVVPGLPDWKYDFHGKGCCLKNSVNGTLLDVDFSKDGGSSEIDFYFFWRYLKSIEFASFPESVLKRDGDSFRSWEAYHQDVFEEVGLLSERKLTEFGLGLNETLQSPLYMLRHLIAWEATRLAGVWLLLHLGDPILAFRYLEGKRLVPENLEETIRCRAEAVKDQRTEFWRKRLGAKLADRDLFALADCGRSQDHEFFIRCLQEFDDFAVSNAAFDILESRNLPEFPEILENLLVVYSGTTVTRTDEFVEANRLVKWVGRLYLLRKETLSPNIRNVIRSLLLRSKKPGIVGFYLYLIDHDLGLKLLEVAEGYAPEVGACVLINTPRTLELLKRWRHSSNPLIRDQARIGLSILGKGNFWSQKSTQHWSTNYMLKDMKPLAELLPGI